MSETYYSLSRERLTETGNQMRDVFLNAMLKENIITEKQHNDMLKYSIILAKKSYLGSFWNKLWRKENENDRIVIVKVIEHIDDDPKDEEPETVAVPKSDEKEN